MTVAIIVIIFILDAQRRQVEDNRRRLAEEDNRRRRVEEDNQRRQAELAAAIHEIREELKEMSRRVAGTID